MEFSPLFRIVSRVTFVQLILGVLLTPCLVSKLQADGTHDLEASERNALPMPLDLSRHFQKKAEAIKQLSSFSGKQVVDGLPFQIDGRISLQGKTEAERKTEKKILALGVNVGCKFDQLSLIHHTIWPDVEGETVAYICLNYEDETKFLFPIRYGHHVRDWYNLPSFETEKLADPQTRVCYRHAPFAFKAPLRFFKSTLTNPFPDKVVVSIDAVSNSKLATYNLLAATVSAGETVSEGYEPFNRDFDAKIELRVIDNDTGEPIEGALVIPSMTVEGEGVVGSPVRTSPDGKGGIPFPTEETKSIYARVSKEGYASSSKSWDAPESGEYTVRLKPVAAR